MRTPLVVIVPEALVAGRSSGSGSPLKRGVRHSALHRDAGSYAAALKLTSPAFTEEFRPATPVLLMPDPAGVGRSSSWSATSTDCAMRVSTRIKLLRQESLTFGGARVDDTVVLQTHAVLSGNVRYDAQLTVWWAPAYRLPVKTHTVGKGAYSGFRFTTDVTAVLSSAKPS